MSVLFLSFNQNQIPTTDSICGIWKRTNKDSIYILELGPKKNNFTIKIINRNSIAVYTLNATKDTLFNKSNYLIIDKNKLVLYDNFGFEGTGKTVYYKTGNFSSNIKQIPTKNSSFFDFSTNLYYAGTNWDLCPKATLPFYINRNFIKTKKIDSLKIEKFKGKSTEDIKKTNDLIFYFDQYGNILKLKIYTYASYSDKIEDTFVWDYFYQNDKVGLLKKITIPKDSIIFDDDNWEIKKNKKEIPHLFLVWNKYNSIGLPLKATLFFRYMEPYIEFYYNKSNQLIRTTSVDKSMPGIKGFHSNLYYDSNGILNKIVDIQEDRK